MEAGSGEKVEEFVVLHQEPSASEAISPRVARPYIQALHSINLDGLPEVDEQQPGEVESKGNESVKDEQESQSQDKEDPAQIEELNAVMEQVHALFSCTVWKLEMEKNKFMEYSQTKFSVLSLYYHLSFPSNSSHRLKGMPCITWSTFTSVTKKVFSR